ncbi:MAG: hypothetical protein AMXMBFR59_13090 [Rhodanobacteraceae bacterium]
MDLRNVRLLARETGKVQGAALRMREQIVVNPYSFAVIAPEGEQLLDPQEVQRFGDGCPITCGAVALAEQADHPRERQRAFLLQASQELLLSSRGIA